MLFSGIAEVREWFDDETNRFRIDVAVKNRVWGPLFGYSGWFETIWHECSAADVPADVRPVREEPRE
jgi:hypothetical protein